MWNIDVETVRHWCTGGTIETLIDWLGLYLGAIIGLRCKRVALIIDWWWDNLQSIHSFSEWDQIKRQFSWFLAIIDSQLSMRNDEHNSDYKSTNQLLYSSSISRFSSVCSCWNLEMYASEGRNQEQPPPAYGSSVYGQQAKSAPQPGQQQAQGLYSQPVVQQQPIIGNGPPGQIIDANRVQLQPGGQQQIVVPVQQQQPPANAPVRAGDCWPRRPFVYRCPHCNQVRLHHSYRIFCVWVHSKIYWFKTQSTQTTIEHKVGRRVLIRFCFSIATCLLMIGVLRYQDFSFWYAPGLWLIFSPLMFFSKGHKDVVHSCGGCRVFLHRQCPGVCGPAGQQWQQWWKSLSFVNLNGGYIYRADSRCPPFFSQSRDEKNKPTHFNNFTVSCLTVLFSTMAAFNAAPCFVGESNITAITLYVNQLSTHIHFHDVQKHSASLKRQSGN